MKDDFKITSEDVQAKVPVTVFYLSGWLDAQSEEKFVKAAGESYETGARFLLVDMSGLKTLTSAGMRALQKVYKLYTPIEERFKVSHLKLCNASPQISSVLGITGFLQNIPMYDSVDGAIKDFGEK